MSFVTRATPLGDGRPLTLDESARSVEVVASTQAPVTVFDFEEWQPIREVLLMSGCQIPESGRVPLLDCHSREHAGDIVGSFDHIRVEDGPQGPQLVGRAVFSATPDGEAPFRKVVEGHLTDVSVGYDVIAYQRIRAGEVAVIEGVTYEGPLRVTTQWRLLELSCVPIGADSFAKMRSAINNLQSARKGKKERVMSKESGQHERGKIAARLRALLGLREDPEEQPAPEEEPRQAVVTDGSGTTVEPEQLDDAELDQLVDDLGALLDEAEAEQEGEIKEIFDWARTHVTSTLYICWGAQAGLYHFYGVPKYPLEKKMFGIFKQKPLDLSQPIFRGFDDVFSMPHSRHTEVRREDIEKVPGLDIIAESPESGVSIVMARNGREFFVTGHLEYAPNTLDKEYKRDMGKRDDVELPKNYYYHDDPNEEPLVTWRAHANLFYSNWINYYVYQETPYNIDEIS